MAYLVSQIHADRLLMGPNPDCTCLTIYDRSPTAEELELDMVIARANSRWVDLKLARDAEYLLRVGDSAFTDIGAWTGDMLMISPFHQNLANGDTALIQVGDTITARRYYQVPDGFRLEPVLLAGVPINPAEVQLVGIVRGILRAM